MPNPELDNILKTIRGEPPNAPEPEPEPAPTLTNEQKIDQAAGENRFAKAKGEELKARFKTSDEMVESLRANMLPQHAEIMRVHEAAKVETKMQVYAALMEKAFQEYGGNTLDLSKAKEYDDSGINFGRARLGKRDGEATIFYRNVRDGKGRPTGEVMLIVDMNNDKNNDAYNKEGNTIMTALVKVENGKVAFDKNNLDGLFNLRSQKEIEDSFEIETEHPKWRAFIDNTKFHDTRAEAMLVRGELNRNQYLKEFKREQGTPLQKFWKQHDEDTTKTAKFAESEANKGELLERLNTNYAEILQQVENEKHAQIERFETEVREITARHDEIFDSAMELLSDIDTLSGTEKSRRRIQKTLLRLRRDDDAEEIDAYLNEAIEARKAQIHEKYHQQYLKRKRAARAAAGGGRP